MGRGTLVKYRKWNIGEADRSAVDTLRSAGYSWLLASVLAARGVTTPEAAAEKLERERALTLSPLLMKDMDRAVARIQRAIADGETVAVFGDYDVDGITATVVVEDYLRRQGVNCLRYIPRRVEDGYGLSLDAIRRLREQGATLLITVDCGVTGVDEVDYARSLGMDVVVTDHHECRETLPRAVAVVNPHRPDCPYPFKHLAGVGVALKLVLALGGESREDALFARYCTLAAIGTIADVMLMEGENRTIVSCGLEALPHTDFAGLHALLREAGLSDKPLSSVQVGFALSPRINAAGRMGEADLAAELLECADPDRAEALAKELCQLNRERQSVEQDICADAIDQIGRLPASERSALVPGQRALASGGGGHRGLPPQREVLLPQLHDPSKGRHGQGLLPLLGRLQPLRRPRELLRPSGGVRRPRAGRGLHHPGGEYPRLPLPDEPLRPRRHGRQPPRPLPGRGLRRHQPRRGDPLRRGGAGDAGALRRRESPGPSSPCWAPRWTVSSPWARGGT